MPRGAMFMLLGLELEKFPNIGTSFEFMELLVQEQSVLTHPSELFHLPGFLRLTLTMPTAILVEVCERLSEFCHKYTINEQ
jgi:tyrosine aminotransferase